MGLRQMSQDDYVAYVRSHLPKRYLQWIFKKSARGPRVEVLAGFLYTYEEAMVNGFDTSHGAIDYRVKRGTVLLAPHSGWLMSTFEEAPAGRLFSRDWAFGTNPNERHIKPADEGPTKDQEQFSGGGYMLQLVDPATGLYSQFCHLDEVLVPKTPFECKITPQGVLPSPKLRMLPGEFNNRNAVWVEAGEPIATSGISGCGWGKSSYSYVSLTETRAPNFSNIWIPHWSDPHAHHLMGMRHPFTRQMAIIDPFGNYGTRELYDTSDIGRPGRYHPSLWLAS